ncbi:MAG: hypothetical protein ACLGGX_10210 [Bdellovibrionia bacterium]
MKNLVFASTLLFATSAFAETTLFKCMVPAETPAVTLEVTKGDDVSIDFVTVQVVTKSTSFVLFNQLDKGAADQMVKAGEFSMMVLGEQFGQVDGVIKDAGLIQISQTSPGVYEGFLLAKGDIYPLACTK